MLNFFKNILMKGLVVLIPLVLLYITFRELLEIKVSVDDGAT
jgi:hypothetical protein